jgi:Ca2+-binding EF-hand superfamily protein
MSGGDLTMLFECFDAGGCGKVSNKNFVEVLLPINNEALRNAVTKRIATDL